MNKISFSSRGTRLKETKSRSRLECQIRHLVNVWGGCGGQRRKWHFAWRQLIQITKKTFALQVMLDCICAKQIVFVFDLFLYFLFCIVLSLQCIDDGNLIMNGDLPKILTGDFLESSRA